jgi:hypothetical protein
MMAFRFRQAIAKLHQRSKPPPILVRIGVVVMGRLTGWPGEVAMCEDIFCFQLILGIITHGIPDEVVKQQLSSLLVDSTRSFVII